ncbi:HpcH/HpaI aldolase/citrate lyase family protein [Burkholderia stagnalis]
MSSPRPQRARRVQLSTPGSSEKMLAKAAASDADHVFLDLEDAVAPNQKVAARGKIIEALNTLDWGKKVRCVRINDLSTEYAYEDIIEIVEGAGRNLDTIMMTKVTSAADVLFAGRLLSMMEKKLGLERRIGLEALIEEVEGMQNVEAIARSSDRLECLIFGMGDFSASMGISLDAAIGGASGYPGDMWHYARFRLVMACRAAGLDAVDGPYADFRNDEGYREECRRAGALGMLGKWAIHPNQIAIAREVFSPDPEKVASARKLVSEYAAAEAEGAGAIRIDGMMVDVATVRLLRNGILKRADLYGM